jgi:hypothetical protein
MALHYLSSKFPCAEQALHYLSYLERFLPFSAGPY